MNQRDIEKKTLKNQLLPRLREEAKEILKHFLKDRDLNDKKVLLINNNLGLAIKVQAFLLLYKRMHISTLAGLLDKEVTDINQLPSLLMAMSILDIIDYDGSMFITRATLDDVTQLEVDEYCYPLPMIEEPKRLNKNNESPYLTVKRDSVILRDNYTDEDVVLEYLNHQNSIPLEINEFSLIHNKNSWNTESEISKRQFERFNKATQKVLWMYKKNTFYLTWKYDKRGRSYDQGYHIHIQGNDYSKAIVQFAKKEILEN